LYKLLNAPIGFESGHLAAVRLLAPSSRYSGNDQMIALARRVMGETGQLPGVESVAVTHQIPVANIAGGSTTFEVLGRALPQVGNEANGRQVSASYFSTIRARLLRGRWFNESDDASRPFVVLVNRTFAQRYFSGEDPLEKTIRFDASQPSMRIIGVVEDIREGALDSAVLPALYTPFNQQPDPIFFVVVRTAQEPGAILSSLTQTVHQIDPEILTMSAETLTDRIDHLQSTYLHRSSTWLVAAFAGFALLLSVVGIYGVIGYSVSQRTREIGVRLALGAQHDAVYSLILGEAFRLVAVGIAVGLIAAVAAGSLINKLLFGVRPWDGATLAGVAIVLTVAAMFAALIPARRAASIEAVEALRAE
jgi:macrolide transport system ATP-binding/permease protein